MSYIILKTLNFHILEDVELIKIYKSKDRIIDTTKLSFNKLVDINFDHALRKCGTYACKNKYILKILDKKNFMNTFKNYSYNQLK